MSVTVTTVEPTDRRIAFHNGFAWFLDGVFGGHELPAHFFGQGAGPSENDPGALPADKCAEFAAAVDAMSDEQLEQRMWATPFELSTRQKDGEDSDMGPAIATVRELVELATFAEAHGGLRTRHEDASDYVMVPRCIVTVNGKASEPMWPREAHELLDRALRDAYNAGAGTTLNLTVRMVDPVE